MKRMLGYAALLIIVAVAGFAAYVRLAPSDPQVWHQPAPAALAGPAAKMIAEASPADLVVARTDGASATVTLPGKSGAQALAAVDAVAMATARTTRLAGAPETGRITWITRSALWGFPDYTTAEVAIDSDAGSTIILNARLRFGGSDLGVNAARLRDWLGKLRA